MVEILRRLGLGMLLICLSAVVLLYTDRDTRLSARQARPKDSPLRIALVQHTTLGALDDGARGTVERLAERGFRDGERVQISRFNAEGDLGTANTIAKAVTGGDYDLIISISTPSLQTIANANRSGARTRHVFGVVTDPAGAGVGI
ncbi:MAG: ABC transporter substrate binding protein, partial [Limisphaerales bacterium]